MIDKWNNQEIVCPLALSDLVLANVEALAASPETGVLFAQQLAPIAGVSIQTVTGLMANLINK